MGVRVAVAAGAKARADAEAEAKAKAKAKAADAAVAANAVEQDLTAGDAPVVQECAGDVKEGLQRVGPLTLEAAAAAADASCCSRCCASRPSRTAPKKSRGSWPRCAATVMKSPHSRGGNGRPRSSSTSSSARATTSCCVATARWRRRG